MRTSRLARDTARIVSATTSRRRQPTPAAAAAAATAAPSTNVKKEDADEDHHATPADNTNTNSPSEPDSNSDSPLSSLDSDFEDPSKTPRTTVITTTRKRKRKLSTSPTRIKRETTTTTTTTTTHTSPHKAPVRARRTPAKKRSVVDPTTTTTGAVVATVTTPPADWEEVYALTAQMRAQVLAPVDTMGCEALADTRADPKDQRFQTLVSLMLSSQTKDTVTAAAVRDLQRMLPGGLCVRGVLEVEGEVLNGIIGKVGFHNVKTKSLKATARILADQYEGDIPGTIEGLMGLPGVGPKMSYLCMSAAWGRDEGIGVDVHVHRITNLWRWHKTKTPEETRAALEAWLPRDKWHDINHLLVGFGQTWCPPVGRKCDKCMLADRRLCPSAVLTKTTKSTKIEEEAKIKVEYSHE